MLISKRKRFIITSFLLTSGFAAIQFLEQKYKFAGIGILGIITLIFFYWSLFEGLGFNFTLVSLILPFLFTVGVGFFWFLLPANIFTQVPVLLFYALVIYSLCLTQNIFTVAAIRTIALLRAARGVGFVLTLLVSFLLFNTIISLKLFVWWEVFLIWIASFLIFFQGLWQVLLNSDFEKDLVLYSFFLSFFLAEVGSLLFFWPVTVVVGSLFLTSLVYVLLGLVQAKLEGKLFPQAVREYLLVGFFVLISMFFATSWGR